MPIYMDRHDVSESVTAEHIARLHQQDLAIQHLFGCRGLTYWFDDKRKTAFCLIEAPNEQAIREMHDYAHGSVPHRVIEVDPDIVESFLGRIEDPEKAQNVELNIINDPAFRTIMVIDWQVPASKDPVWRKNGLELLAVTVPAVLAAFNGSLVKQSHGHFLVSFRNVSNAVHAGLDLQTRFADIELRPYLKIGISTGVPVTEKNLIFEEAVRLAQRMTKIIKEPIVVSAEVRALYESENPGGLADKKGLCCLTLADEDFITRLMDYAEKSWNDMLLKVDDFNREVGYSKPQLYRKMILLTGKSPIDFIKEYRLDGAMSLLNKGTGNVSQIAYESGFSSPSYFAKCFQKRYGLSPTEYLSGRKG
jgi:AraC-like DNA-binding protein